MRRQRPTIDLTIRLEAILVDLCRRLPEFQHIDPRRMLVCMAQARGSLTSGVFAKIIPMRFADGTPFHTAQGHCFALPQIPTAHGDILYLIYVYLPRFFSQSFERRLLVLIHELYHIAPLFDGTLRKIGARAHGASRAQFNANLQPLIDAYLAGNPPEELLAILRVSLPELSREGALVGRTLPIPKAVRVPHLTSAG